MRPADQDLLERIQAREAAAFELFFARYRESVCRYLAGMVRDESAARDLAQEVFLRVWTRAEQWDGRGVARAWLFRIATNLALNHLRSLRRRREQLLELPPDSTGDEESPAPAWMVDAATLGPEAALEQAEQMARLRRLVDDLPEEKREVFRMAHDGELEMREIAQRLAIPEGTVRSRLYHARRRLAQAWKELQREET